MKQAEYFYLPLFSFVSFLYRPCYCKPRLTAELRIYFYYASICIRTVQIIDIQVKRFNSYLLIPTRR